MHQYSPTICASVAQLEGHSISGVISFNSWGPTGQTFPSLFPFPPLPSLPPPFPPLRFHEAAPAIHLGVCGVLKASPAGPGRARPQNSFCCT